MEVGGCWKTSVTPELELFLADLEMFNLRTANAEGQPYIQYRGGSPASSKLSMDFARSRRIKLWGTIRVVEDDVEILEKLRDQSYPGKVKRAILLQIDAWEVNCPQHIHKRFTHKQIAAVIEPTQAKTAN